MEVLAFLKKVSLFASDVFCAVICPDLQLKTLFYKTHNLLSSILM